MGEYADKIKERYFCWKINAKSNKDDGKININLLIIQEINHGRDSISQVWSYMFFQQQQKYLNA